MKSKEKRCKKLILLSNLGTGAKGYLEKLNPYIESMAYIPSRSDFGPIYYKRVVETYSEVINNFIYCDLESNNSEETKESIINSDVIFIAGGDECFILKTMLTNGMKERFEDYLNDGGIIIGLCAGAEVLSQDIILVEETKKSNRVVALDFGLGLIDFVVFPRYNEFENREEILKYHERIIKETILIGLDSFVVLNGDDILKVGNIEII